MKSAYLCVRIVPVATFLLAFPFLTGADGKGCGEGGTIAIGSGADEGGVTCGLSDCAGLGAAQDAKLCSGGTSLARTVCALQAGGKCGWDFPPCPTSDAGPICQCAGPAPGAPSVQCSDGSNGGPICEAHADGTCSWAIRSCPGDAAACLALGCFPRCPSGVLKDANGCDTCQCAPAVDSGACTTDADCASGVCGFPSAAGCSATGTCFPSSGIACQAYSAGCACDGSEINVACNGLPSGYERKPLLHAGTCSTAGDGGTIAPSGDGGPCCPATWALYSCTYPDGSSALACHDPAKGCASSTRCGVGCDPVVTGACVP